MLKYIDDAKNNLIKNPEVVVNKRINTLATELGKKENAMQLIKQLAPNLANKIKIHYERHQKQRERHRGRDR